MVTQEKHNFDHQNYIGRNKVVGLLVRSIKIVFQKGQNSVTDEEKCSSELLSSSAILHRVSHDTSEDCQPYLDNIWIFSSNTKDWAASIWRQLVAVMPDLISKPIFGGAELFKLSCAPLFDPVSWWRLRFCGSTPVFAEHGLLHKFLNKHLVIPDWVARTVMRDQSRVSFVLRSMFPHHAFYKTELQLEEKLQAFAYKF